MFARTMITGTYPLQIAFVCIKSVYHSRFYEVDTLVKTVSLVGDPDTLVAVAQIGTLDA